jgi:tRNA(Ile2) C34 agmatinyltransferase TiaS
LIILWHGIGFQIPPLPSRSPDGIFVLPGRRNSVKERNVYIYMKTEERDMAKKEVLTVCRICGSGFRGQSGSYRCPRCKEQDRKYKAQREKLRRSLPYYLKTDV